MWIARNNWVSHRGGGTSLDDLYVICFQKPRVIRDNEEEDRAQFQDDSGITYCKIPVGLFETAHPEVRLSPGEGPFWFEPERRDIPEELKGHRHIRT